MMRAGRLSYRALVLSVIAGMAVPSLAVPTTCDPRITAKVFDTGTADQIARWAPAKERLLRVQALVGQDRWSRVANDCIDVIDPNGSGLERITVHKWVEATVNPSITDAELADVIRALDGLRDSSGRLHVGLLMKSATGDGSTRWLMTAATGNRGHFYEVIGARNLIGSGYVNPNRVHGFGIRLLEVEGDLVEALDVGGLRFIDFKAADGSFRVAELERVRDALMAPNSPIGEFVFAVETESFPSDWVNRLQEINDELLAAGLKPIDVRNAGSFR